MPPAAFGAVDATAGETGAEVEALAAEDEAFAGTCRRLWPPWLIPGIPAMPPAAFGAVDATAGETGAEEEAWAAEDEAFAGTCRRLWPP